MDTLFGKLISWVRIERLFGLYTYALPGSGILDNAAILYGENGLGKSTILRLVFHLLSTADNKGHRGALFRADFKILQVALSSGVEVRAEKIDVDGTTYLDLAISRLSECLVQWRYSPKSDEKSDFIIRFQNEYQTILKSTLPIKDRAEVDKILKGEKAFLKILAKHAPTIFILNADRQLDSDSVADVSDEIETRRALRSEDVKKVYELVARSREIALSQALNKAFRWITRTAVHATNQGTLNVHSAYSNLLQLISTQSSLHTTKSLEIMKQSKNCFISRKKLVN